MRRFRSSERIHDVLNFLRWKGVQVQGLVLTAQFPRKVSGLTAPCSYPGLQRLFIEYSVYNVSTVDITNSMYALQVFSDSQQTLRAAGISNMETLNLQAN